MPTRENPVYIEVAVERLYGLHIGTPMKVRYTVKTLNSTKVRFDTLMRGRAFALQIDLGAWSVSRSWSGKRRRKATPPGSSK